MTAHVSCSTLSIQIMKFSHIILSLVFLAISSSVSFAQDRPKKLETVTFEVSGVCGMCEQRIEQAALIKGVKFADWDRTTQMIKVIYKTKKVDLATIQAAITAVGHDVGELKASNDVYSTLPGCCSYRDGAEVH